MSVLVYIINFETKFVYTRNFTMSRIQCIRYCLDTNVSVGIPNNSAVNNPNPVRNNRQGRI